MSKPLIWKTSVVAASLLSCLVAAPAGANPAHIYYGSGYYRSYPNYGTIIYGSPIPAPVPVDPYTGTPVFSNFLGIQNRQPIRRRRNLGIDRPVLIPNVDRPVILNPTIIYTYPYSPVYQRQYGY